MRNQNATRAIAGYAARPHNNSAVVTPTGTPLFLRGQAEEFFVQIQRGAKIVGPPGCIRRKTRSAQPINFQPQSYLTLLRKPNSKTLRISKTNTGETGEIETGVFAAAA